MLPQRKRGTSAGNGAADTRVSGGLQEEPCH